MSETHAPTLVNVPADVAVAVIWIDWYPYHVARFQGIAAAPGLVDRVVGIELVGGIGVHAGLKFREELPAGLPVITLLPESDWRKAGQLRLAVLLWKALNRINPKFVLVPGYYTLPAIAAALWARFRGRASVLMTESTAADHARAWWKEKLKSLLIRGLFDWAIAGGAAHRLYLKELGFPPDRVMRFYDVVDNAYFHSRSCELRQQTPSEFGLPADYFLYVGRLSIEKNISGLIEEWSEYRRAGGSCPLVIAGDGASRRELEQTALGSDYASEIHFVGHKGFRELPTMYAFAKCFVLPSTREPWGLVVNEAMAAGLPVIVSNRCGSAQDLVDASKSGLIFDPYCKGDLAECMGQIEALSPAELEAMGARSLEIIHQYSPGALGAEVARMVCRSGAVRPLTQPRPQECN